MSNKEAKILGFVGGLIILLIIFATVRIKSSDAEFSIGWQTTVYPRDITLSILAIIILVLGLFFYVVFRSKSKS